MCAGRKSIPIAVASLLALPAMTACARQVACDSIITFADRLEPTLQIHVAPDGSNTTGDGSEANPYATIAFAAERAVPGTSVVVHSGVYAGGGFIGNFHGTPEMPFWIGGAAGEARPIIDGGGEGLHFARARYVIVHDLEVRNAAFNGINADDGGDVDDPLASHHLVFRNLDIHDIGGDGNQDGLKLSGINEFAVIDCQFARCGGGDSGSGIDHVGCHHGVIARCTFEEMSGNAIQCKGGSEDLEIRWCTFVDCGQRAINIGGSTGFAFFRPPLSMEKPNVEARDIRVLSSIFQGSLCAVAFVGSVECVVSNNTIVDPTNWLFRILQETVSSGEYEFLPCSDNTFRNNIVYFDFSDLSTYVNIGANTEPATFTYAHNLWYAHDRPGASQPANLGAPEAAGIYGIDPLFADAQSLDCSIDDASAASGAGQTPALSEGDFAGKCYGEPPSIGALEADAKADLDDDGTVGASDLAQLLAQWGACDTGDLCTADIVPPAGDGSVGPADLAELLANWS